MPILTLKLNGKTLQTYPVTPEKNIRIGRREDNDIMIRDTAVSGIHAEIESEGNSYYLTDFNSRNGTFVNKELVISRQLKDGDIVSIGNHSLEFSYEENEVRPEEKKSGDYQATMQIDTPIHRAKLARSVAEIADRKIDNKPVPVSAGVLTFLSGEQEPVHISTEPITIGKDPQCDIVVKGWLVGKQMAQIYQKSGSFYLRPLEARSKMKINYRPVKSEVVLKEFDVIEIGSITLQFHLQNRDPSGENR